MSALYQARHLGSTCNSARPPARASTGSVIRPDYRRRMRSSKGAEDKKGDESDDIDGKVEYCPSCLSFLAI